MEARRPKAPRSGRRQAVKSASFDREQQGVEETQIAASFDQIGLVELADELTSIAEGTIAPFLAYEMLTG